MSMNTPKQMRKESAMKTLYEAMRDFDARNANENTIQGMFAEIAVPALSGGYFLVNNDTRIYPMDIEFYLYGERKEEEPWMKDANMYHKGPKVPYIPVIGSFYPNESGVDVTFENEKGEYRASFLIRAYKYEENGEVISTPRYLWEDLFSYGSFFGDGLHITWVDAPEDADVNIETDVRHNLKNGKGEPDTKPWRFYRA